MAAKLEKTDTARTQAREAVGRAFVEILRARHPDRSWRIVRETQRDAAGARRTEGVA